MLYGLPSQAVEEPMPIQLVSAACRPAAIGGRVSRTV